MEKESTSYASKLLQTMFIQYHSIIKFNSFGKAMYIIFGILEIIQLVYIYFAINGYSTLLPSVFSLLSCVIACQPASNYAFEYCIGAIIASVLFITLFIYPILNNIFGSRRSKTSKLIYTLIGSAFMIYRSIFLVPIIVAYIYAIQTADSSNSAILIVCFFGAIVILTLVIIMVVTGIFFNDRTLKSVLPWGCRPVEMEIVIIIQKLLIGYLVLLQGAVMDVCLAVILILSFFCYKSFLQYIGNNNGICKTLILVHISITIWLSIGTFIKSIMNCSEYYLLPFIIIIPGVTYVLGIYKERKKKATIKVCSFQICENINDFNLYFSELMNCYTHKSNHQKSSELIGVILKHKISCKDALCPCVNISINSFHSEGAKLAQRSLFFDRSQVFDSPKVAQRSSQYFEDQEVKKNDSVDEGMLEFFNYQLRIHQSYNIYSSIPLIFSCFFHFYIKGNVYTALYELEKSSNSEIGIYDKFCFFHTK